MERTLEPRPAPAYIYENQEAAAKEIVRHFLRGNQYVMLSAQMQSGKTGTFQTVAKKMLANGRVDRVFIISGSNEVELLQQAREDTQKYNPEAVAAGKIKVIFRQHFAATVTFELKKTLVIVEESHLDQTKGQQMDKFLKRMGLSLNGEMPTSSTYIVSVSATPFSEVSSLTYNKSVSKAEVKLIPAEGYRGVKYFLENNLIHEFFDISSRQFGELVRSSGNKYNLIRITSRAKMEELARKYTRVFDVRFFLQEKKTISISDMAVAPTKPTIVFLNGLLRCGKVVPKNHIGFVWEGGKKPKADTALQGLLGRMCGYYATGAASPHIYISSTILKKKLVGDKMMNELDRYVEFADGSALAAPMMPTTGMNLKGVKERKEQEREPAYAHCFKPGELYDDLTDEADAGRFIKTHFTDTIRNKISDVYRECILVSNEQREEIMSILTGIREPNTREFKISSSATQKRYLNELIVQSDMGESTTQLLHIGVGELVKMAMCYVAYGEKAGCIYVVFQLLAKRTEGHLEERIAKSTSNEIFSQSLPEGVTLSGGIVYGFTTAIETDAGEFERQWSELVSDRNDYENGVRGTFVNNIVTAMGGDKSINLCRSVYTKQLINAIKKRIEEKFNYKITIVYGAPFTDVIRIKKIEWTRASLTEPSRTSAAGQSLVETEPSRD